MPDQQRIISTLSANGNSTQFFFTNSRDALSGIFLHLSGTFGSGTVKLQFQGNDGTWRDVTTVSYTAATDKYITLPAERNYRLNLSGATSPSIYFEIAADGAGNLRV